MSTDKAESRSKQANTDAAEQRVLRFEPQGAQAQVEDTVDLRLLFGELL